MIWNNLRNLQSPKKLKHCNKYLIVEQTDLELELLTSMCVPFCLERVCFAKQCYRGLNVNAKIKYGDPTVICVNIFHCVDIFMIFNSLICCLHDIQNIQQVLTTQMKWIDIFIVTALLVLYSSNSLTKSFADCSYKIYIPWPVTKPIPFTRNDIKPNKLCK